MRAWWRGGALGRGWGQAGVDRDAEETFRVKVSRIYLSVCTLKDFWQIWEECVFRFVFVTRDAAEKMDFKPFRSVMLV